MIGRLAFILFAATVLPTLAAAADAGDRSKRLKHTPGYSAHMAPYPPSWRAGKVRSADRCWRDCVADAGREFRACLRGHRLTECVQLNADADRSCLRKCRLAGGPWVEVE